jgi:von Willebrand factor type A domain
MLYNNIFKFSITISKLVLSLLLTSTFLSLAGFAQTKMTTSDEKSPEVVIESYQTKGKKVKLVVGVKQNNQPLTNLSADLFELKVNGININNRQINSLQQNPTPTNIVILLDASGSMENQDGATISRKDGAIAAIQKIEDGLKEKPIRINLITFGEGGSKCLAPKPVSEELRPEKFLELGNEKDRKKLADKLDVLKSTKLCASTDLYNPLISALNFIKVEMQQSINSGSRFAVILLSDGFHSHNRTCINGQDNEPMIFENLRTTIKQSKNIPIYTIGYGISEDKLKELIREKIGDNNPSSDASQFVCKYRNHPKYKEVEMKFLDSKRLKEISQINSNGGEYKQSDQAAEIAKTVTSFVNSIVGKYELEYSWDSAQAGESQNVTVSLKNPISVSKPYQVTFDNWVFERFSRDQLFTFTGISLIGLLGWVLTFYQWSKMIKKQSKKTPENE